MHVAAPLAYVRLEDGTVAELEEGAPVPDDADQEHVDELLEKCALVDEDAEGDGGKGGGTPDPDPPVPPAKRTVARPGPPAGGSSN